MLTLRAVHTVVLGLLCLAPGRSLAPPALLITVLLYGAGALSAPALRRFPGLLNLPNRDEWLRLSPQARENLAPALRGMLERTAFIVTVLLAGLQATTTLVPAGTPRQVAAVCMMALAPAIPVTIMLGVAQLVQQVDELVRDARAAPELPRGGVVPPRR